MKCLYKNILENLSQNYFHADIITPWKNASLSSTDHRSDIWKSEKARRAVEIEAREIFSESNGAAYV